MIRYCVIWMLVALFWLATIVYGAERHHIEQRPDNTYIAFFVHGFTGDYLKTWGKLPELLQTDPSLDQYDFLFWGYPSSLFLKNEDIGATGKLLKTEIDYLSKPYDKIVLIGHSMGGLVIRSYIVQALIDGKGNDLKTIADVMLFGVPNEGDLKAQGVPKWVNDQIANLGVASQFITELRKYWIQRVTAAPHNDDFHQAIPTVAVAGYQDHFVSQQSVESFFRETAMTDGDHRSMVKPETTSHLTYRIIHKRLIDAAKKPHRRVSNDVQAIVEKLLEAHRRELERFQQREQAAQDQIKSLTAAVTSLAEQQDKPDALPGIDAALDQLQQGNTEKAERIFEDILKRKTAEGQTANQQAAEAARHLGALAFLHDTDKALNAYRRAVSLDPENAEGWFWLGRLLTRTGLLEEAESSYRKIFPFKINTHSHSWIVQAHNYLGSLYRDQGKYEQAKIMYNRALELNNEIRNEKVMAHSYNGLGVLNAQKGNFEQAKIMYNKALEINKALGHKEGMAIDYVNLGLLYKNQGNFEQAEAMYHKALEVNETLGRKEGIAHNYTNLGNVYRLQGKFEQAEKLYNKSLEINETLGHKEGIARNYTNLGVIYKNQGKQDQAELLFRNALALYESLDYKFDIARDATTLGNMYRSQGKLEQAETMYRKALAHNEALNHQLGLAKNYNGLATVYFILDKLEQAESMYRKALDLNKTLDRKLGIARNYNGLALVYVKRKNPGQAEVMFRKAMAINEVLGHKTAIAQNALHLCVVYYWLDKLEQAEIMAHKALGYFQEKYDVSHINKIQSLIDTIRRKRLYQ